jgi:AcrR family transcriptional regulator
VPDAETEAEPPRRRRGAELEAAILDAAWDELVARGFANLTMESVAARSRTGVAVLYRRWPNKQQLVLAAMEHYRSTHPVESPDTGSLRGDLIANLESVAAARAAFFAIGAATAFSGLASADARTPAEVRDELMGDGRERRPRVREVYRRAAERDELDLGRVPAAVLAMPYDLVRHDLLQDLAPPSRTRITSIVDELFLPLVREHAADGGAEH